MDAVWNEIVVKTKQFVKNAGFNKVVIGLSGGIDSAVVACIAAQAFGPQNLLAVMMPSPYSSPGSITDSEKLALNWKFETANIPITPLMGAFDSLQPFFRGSSPGTTEENLQARIRAVLLMALSNKRKLLLLNTCNKSEDYVGYCTLYGDSCGAVAPLGGLYKTQVYALAKWINDNTNLPCIPEEILTKEPSAELSQDQKDTDSLPPYDVLDAVLTMVVDEHLPAEMIKLKGFNEALVKKVIQLVESSEFKRQQSPPVIEITGSTL